MVKVQGHGQIPIRSRAHVYAGGSGGEQRRAAAAARSGRARAVGETKIFFSVSSNPGRGGKNFFFEKSMENFFFGSKRVGDNGLKSVSWGFGWEVFFWVRSDRSIGRVRLGLKNKNPFFKKQNKRELIGFTWMTQVFYSCQGRKDRGLRSEKRGHFVTLT